MKTFRSFLQYAQGFSLIELMIAMTIGMFVLAAVGSVYMGNRSTYRTAESVSRLQDEARVAAMKIRHSLQHAGYFGRLDSPIVINGRRGSGSDLNKPTSDCAPGWAIDLDRPVEAPDTATGNPYPMCLTGGIQRQFSPGRDMLVVRRADSAIANPTDADYIGKIFLRADVQRGELFIADGSNVPSGYPDAPLREDRLLVTEMYFITPDSFDDSDGVPMLRRLYLTDNGGITGLRSEGIAQNVEQFQVQLGEDIDGDGEADLFVDPPNATGRAVSVRFWLLIRSAIREPGLADTNTYVMGDAAYVPPADVQDFRRTLITQTVDLRNL